MLTLKKFVERTNEFFTPTLLGRANLAVSTLITDSMRAKGKGYQCLLPVIL